MAYQPFISVRKYIKWGDDARENTDTLVLTTAQKYFVDIRIYKPTSPSEPIIPTPHLLPYSRLEWGFAGTASSTPALNNKPAHTVWTHLIDSKTTEEVKDEGDMHPQPNGEILEYGAMVNPAKGVVEKYEESWVDLDPLKVKGEEIYVSWTLRTEDAESGVKGMLVRIGVCMQGILRRVEDVSVGRWKWSEAEGWERIAGIGKLDVPQSAWQKVDMSEGEKFVGSDGLGWECIEAFSWS